MGKYTFYYSIESLGEIYTFENLCIQDSSIRLQDETVKVFLNPYSTRNDISTELHNFLLYLVDGTISDSFTKELDKIVSEVRNNNEWRIEYMTLQMKMDESYEEGLAEGLAKSIKVLYFQLEHSPVEIAEEIQIPLEKVNDIINNLEKE